VVPEDRERLSAAAAAEQAIFLQELAVGRVELVEGQGLPVAAMVACLIRPIAIVPSVQLMEVEPLPVIALLVQLVAPEGLEVQLEQLVAPEK
jgi:hypothetical protein